MISPYHLGRRRNLLCKLVFSASVLFQLAEFCVVAADTAHPAVAVSSSTTPVQVFTATSIVISSCTTTTIYISSTTSITISTCALTTEESLKKLSEQLPEAKVQEMAISVSPEMRVYLPAGAFDLSLKHEYRSASMEFNSKYDFVDAIMGYGLDFLYKVSKLSLGVNLADNVNFNEIYAGNQYLQRSQSITPYALYPIEKNTSLKASIKVDDTYTASISSNAVIDKGKNILGEIGLWNNTIVESTSAPRGGSASFVVQHSFPGLGSNYNYTQLELNFKRYFYVYKNEYIDFVFQAGYPVAVTNRPLDSIYFAGGYKVLRGYNFQEFSGDSIIYGTVKYNVPLSKPKEERYFNHISVSMFSWDVFMDAAKIGMKDIYTTPISGKFSAGTGFGYKVVFFKYFPVKLELSAAKAMENRPVYFYFTVSTLYYSRHN